MTPHGTPDFWGQGRKLTTFALNDQAELAVRLGSQVNLDRTGEVVWQSDFSKGGKFCEVLSAGGDSTTYLSTEHSINGGACLVLNTAGGAGATEQVNKYLRMPVLSRLGFELSWFPSSNLRQLQVNIYVYRAAVSRAYQVYYNYQTGALIVYDAAVDPHTIATIETPYILGNLFNNFKLVIDPDTGYFSYVTFNNTRVSASAYQGWPSAGAAAERILYQVVAVTDDGNPASLHIDGMIFTQNEPV